MASTITEGGSFIVPQVTIDSKGRIIKVVNRIITINSVNNSVEIDPNLSLFEQISVTPGTIDWWAKLKELLPYSTAELRAECLGKEISVTLSQEILGTTTHLVICIGYDCDGNNTLTFLTKNCFVDKFYFCASADYSTFGSKALWYDGITNSQARLMCINYFNAFPGKSSIKTISKKYCSTQGSIGSQTSDQIFEETVFLPSAAEMGGTTADTTLAPALDEFCTENTSQIPYLYYTNVSNRIKMGSDSSSTERTYYLRSRFYRTGYKGYVSSVGSDGSLKNSPGAAAASSGNLRYFAPAFVIG